MDQLKKEHIDSINAIFDTYKACIEACDHARYSLNCRSIQCDSDLYKSLLKSQVSNIHKDLICNLTHSNDNDNDDDDD